MQTLTDSTSEAFISQEDKYGAHNYHPLPVVLKKEKGFMYMTWKARNIMIFCQRIQQLIKDIVILKS